MTSDGISEEVKDFLAKYIDSVEGLEILLLLRRNADKEWTAQMVSQALRNDALSASKRLTDLQSYDLLDASEKSGHIYYRYNPKLADLALAVDGLDEAYNERRVRVINLIFSKPIDKIRVFADAFKFRKD